MSDSINLISRVLHVDKSEIVYDFKTFDAADWPHVRNQPGWEITPEAIIGKIPVDAPFRHGQIFYKTPIAGDIIMEFDAELVPPSNHDLVWCWSTVFADDPLQDYGYVGCLGGWWGNYAGVEKAPTNMPKAISPACDIVPGKSYHIVSGTIGNLIFIAVDGRMVTYMGDPEVPSQDTPGYFGFGLYQSHAIYRNLKIRRPFCTKLAPAYTI